MSLYESAVKKPVMTSLVFVGIVILGLFSLSKLPIDLLPNIETNTILVLTSYPGASAADVETNVTRPLESSLNTVSNLKNITSTSRENTSIITLEFEYGEDIEALTNDVREVEVMFFRFETVFNELSRGRVTLVSTSAALAPGYDVSTRMVLVSMLGSKSMGNLLNEKRPRITIPTKTREVITGFFTALSYKLILFNLLF
jgi:hypothetical protein